MAVKFAFKYHVDAQAPRYLSIVLFTGIAPGHEDGILTQDDLDAVNAGILTGSPIPTDRGTWANTIAYNFKHMQAGGVVWDDCRFYESTPGDTNPDNIVYVGNLAITDVLGSTDGAQDILDGMVMGIKGKVTGSGAARKFSVGFLNDVGAKTPFTADITNVVGSEPYSDVLNKLYCNKFLIETFSPMAVSTASTVNRVFRPMTFASKVFKGTKRG